MFKIPLKVKSHITSNSKRPHLCLRQTSSKRCCILGWKIMSTYKFVFLTFIFAISFISCKRSSEPTSPTFRVQLSMEIIPVNSDTATVDSTLDYSKLFIEWNKPSNLLDTTKADSLAQWFAHSDYQITDMWFPNVNTACSIPIQTENVVTLKLAVPDTRLQSIGYSSTTKVVNRCYFYYRHYIFTLIKNGN